MITNLLHLETVAIGDELLTGKISDSNSTYVGNRLFENGLVLKRQTVIADDLSQMTETLHEVSKRAAAVICFGGLGPTSDDKTAECVAQILGTKLVEHAQSKERLLLFLKERGREVTSQVLKQVVFPETTTPIYNSRGLAVGFSFVLNKATLFFLPGVPHEMKAMFEEGVLPVILKLASGTEKVFSHVWRCLELPESELQRKMDAIEKVLPQNGWLGYRTKFPENYLTLYMRGLSEPPQFKTFQSKISAILKQWTYSEGNDDIEGVVLKKLKDKKQAIVFAESCTGGAACQRLTRISGASDCVIGGFTAYQVTGKEKMLQVSVTDPLEAVSQETTKRLALAAKEKTGAHIAAAVTGYMGPTGGTKENPIGTIYLCVVADKVYEKKIVQPWKERDQAQWGAASHLLNLVLTALG